MLLKKIVSSPLKILEKLKKNTRQIEGENKLKSCKYCKLMKINLERFK